ncbi:hypothetical protein JOQ06_024402 [Pogonophryne albipinna]|uniref:MENTAL domain-containing protein n=1 Tax=Pogonophryne albipinna TaxID=1090488 RepID=A0AAD6F5U4_9TELE|nr:hypothetical protein JOQ06_024402 [Pogonophryne albipinna]
MDSRCSSSAGGGYSINSTPTSTRMESFETGEKKGISDVRRTFCLFVTFDLLFITLLWIIELNVNGGIRSQLEREVLQYDYHASFFDIFVLAVFRFMVLILAYAVCRLRHWWAIAITTAVSCAFLIVKVILSKVLPQENEELNRFQSLMDAERAPLMGPGPLSDGQFYSPPESVQVNSDEELDDKHDPEKDLIQQLT